MNYLYWLALICTGLAFLFTYLGSQYDSAEQGRKIEVRLQDLGNQLQAAQSGGSQPPGQVEAIKQEYMKLAKQFFDNLPLKAAEQKASDANALLLQLQTSRELEAHLRLLETTAVDLATAYNATAGQKRITVDSTKFPIDVFADKERGSYRILIDFDKKNYWAIRLVIYPDKTLALEFVRLVKPIGVETYEGMRLTEDSVQLVFIQEKKFRLSLNQAISKVVKEQVAAGAPLIGNMEQLDDVAVLFLRRIIEYQLVAQAI